MSVVMLLFPATNITLVFRACKILLQALKMRVMNGGFWVHKSTTQHIQIWGTSGTLAYGVGLQNATGNAPINQAGMVHMVAT
jgi:hypothetical protein